MGERVGWWLQCCSIFAQLAERCSLTQRQCCCAQLNIYFAQPVLVYRCCITFIPYVNSPICDHTSLSSHERSCVCATLLVELTS